MDYTYPGDESVILRDAEVAGTGTSFSGGDRWSEATVVLTEAGNYFVAVVGKSDVANEVDRHWAVLHTDPVELLRALLRRGQSGGKTLPAYLHRALSDAAAEDDPLNDALDAYESASRWL